MLAIWNWYFMKSCLQRFVYDTDTDTDTEFLPRDAL